MSEQQTGMTLRERLIYIHGRDHSDISRETAVIAAAMTLISEIERRCAERGYTDLAGGWDSYYDDFEETTSIADFIAEIRGEVSGGD